MSRLNFTAIQVEKIKSSLAATYMIGLENDEEGKIPRIAVINGYFQLFVGFQNSEHCKQILNAAKRLFHAESLSQSVNNIVFESTTLPDLAKEQKEHADRFVEGRRNISVDPTSSARYSDFAKELVNMRDNLVENQDSEEPGDEQRQRIDPISKKPIKTPVMNKRCKHIYDKHVVFEALRMNSHLR